MSHQVSATVAKISPSWRNVTNSTRMQETSIRNVGQGKPETGSLTIGGVPGDTDLTPSSLWLSLVISTSSHPRNSPTSFASSISGSGNELTTNDVEASLAALTARNTDPDFLFSTLDPVTTEQRTDLVSAIRAWFKERAGT